ncbi:MAG: sigma-70 family RNA polymerase sigma factor [Tetrasphaera sp.]|jgi:RNA polymerase sigma factor (sigma-70 family)|nr:sigma-70 family RNA polymerase sigma factor [Tetrasphaera sp.]
MNALTEDGVRRLGRDPEALEEFYRAHVRDIERFIARRVADPHEAADLTADVFVALITHSADYRADRGSPLGWAYGIARHTVAEHRRQAARSLRLTARISGRALLDADSLVRVEERLDAERSARSLYAALDTLPAADRAVVELVALDGLTVADAALVLGVKPVTARVRLHRARRKITTHLGDGIPAAPALLEVQQ